MSEAEARAAIEATLAEVTAEVAAAVGTPFAELKAALEARHAAFARRHPALFYPALEGQLQPGSHWSGKYIVEPSPYRESAIGNAPALVPGPLTRR